MGTLTRLIKAAVGAALLKSMSWMMRPSTVRPGYIQALIKGVVTIVLFRSMNRSGLALPAILSAVGALLLSLIRSREGRGEHNDRIIDLDEYTVVDEVQQSMK